MNVNWWRGSKLRLLYWQFRWWCGFHISDPFWKCIWRMRHPLHRHNWIVVDYDDTDRGCVFVECRCGWTDKMAEDPESAEYYGVKYLPGASDAVDRLMGMDATALDVER